MQDGETVSSHGVSFAGSDAARCVATLMAKPELPAGNRDEGKSHEDETFSWVFVRIDCDVRLAGGGRDAWPDDTGHFRHV